MKVWIGFLLISFLIGSRLARRQRPDRFVVYFGLCALVTVAFYSYRWV